MSRNSWQKKGYSKKDSSQEETKETNKENYCSKVYPTNSS